MMDNKDKDKKVYNPMPEFCHVCYKFWVLRMATVICKCCKRSVCDTCQGFGECLYCEGVKYIK